MPTPHCDRETPNLPDAVAVDGKSAGARKRRHHDVLHAGRVLRLYTPAGLVEIQIAGRDRAAKVRLVIDTTAPTTLSHSAKPRIFPGRRSDRIEAKTEDTR